MCQDFTPELTERSPDFSGPMSRGGSGSSHSEQCGVCSSVSHLFRRIMCIGGASRRGSDESYYYHQHPETRLIEVRVEVVTFLSKHLPVNPLDKIWTSLKVLKVTDRTANSLQKPGVNSWPILVVISFNACMCFSKAMSIKQEVFSTSVLYENSFTLVANFILIFWVILGESK